MIDDIKINKVGQSTALKPLVFHLFGIPAYVDSLQL